MTTLIGVRESLTTRGVAAPRAVRRAFGWFGIADGAHAGAVGAIDPDAHYPEGPAWRDGQLYYVEYSASNIKRWDGTRRGFSGIAMAAGPAA